MKTIMAVLVLAVLVLAAGPAIGAETEAGVENLGPVTWTGPEMFSGLDFKVAFSRDGSAMCREVVAGGRCIPIIPEEGVLAVMLRNGQRFLVLFPRTGDF